MPELMGRALDLAVEINRITASAGRSKSDLSVLWAPLRRIVPFAAAWIGVHDAEHRRYLTAAAVGHAAANREYLESKAFHEQVEAVGLFARRRPMCLRDAPLAVSELPSWAEHWWPTGYRVGSGHGAALSGAGWPAVAAAHAGHS
jgi:hypothetical protein